MAPIQFWSVSYVSTGGGGIFGSCQSRCPERELKLLSERKIFNNCSQMTLEAISETVDYNP